jgi:molybdenum cofactor cytidylyltransferase
VNRFIKVSDRVELRPRIGAVVLAAGGSRRLGLAKQLVTHKGQTLLARTIAATSDAGIDAIVVVLGAAAGEIRDSLQPLPVHVHFVLNECWPEGLGTSIACGVRKLVALDASFEGAMILVCDQPALDATVLRKFLRATAASPASIHIADYGTGRGPPVIFPRAYFDELLALRSDSGAREVHRRHADVVRTVPFRGGAIDIDTPEDLDRCDS